MPCRVLCLRNIAFLCAAGIIVVSLSARIMSRHVVEYYVLTEWLINYSTGFVRRGLPGSALLWLHHNFNLDVAAFIDVGACVSFLLVAVYYYTQAFRIRDRLPLHVLAIVLFLPSSILMPVLVRAVMGRKEFLFLLVLIVHIMILNHFVGRLISAADDRDRKAIVKRYSVSIAIAYNVAGIPIVLSHEGALMLSVPLNLALTAVMLCQVYRVPRSIVLAILIYAPVIALSVFILFGMTGPPMSHARVVAICKAVGFVKEVRCLAGAPKYLTLTPHKAIDLVYRENVLHPWVLATWVTLLTANLVLGAYAVAVCTRIKLRQRDFEPGARGTTNRGPRPWPLFLVIFVVPLVATFPLYITAIDWGRWLFVSNTSSLLCALGWSPQALPESALDRMFARRRSAPDVARVPRGRSGPLRVTLGTLAVVAIFYVLSSTTLPHCCLGANRLHHVLTTGILDKGIELIRWLVMQFARLA